MYQNSKHHQSKNLSKKGITNNNNNNNDSSVKPLNSEKSGKKLVQGGPNPISEDKRIKLEAKRKLGDRKSGMIGGGGMTSPYHEGQQQQQLQQQPQQHIKSPTSSNFPSYQVKSSMHNNSSLPRQKQQQEFKPLFSQKEFPALESTCHQHSISHVHSHPHSHSHSMESSSTLKKSSNNNSKTNSPKEHGKLKEKPKEESFHKNNDDDENQVVEPILDHWQMVYTACRKLFKDLDEEKDTDRGDKESSSDCHCPSCIDQAIDADERSKDEEDAQNHEESNGEEKEEESTVEITTCSQNQNLVRDYDFEDWDLFCDSRNCTKKEWQNSEDEDDTTLENNEEDNEDENACDYEWIIIADKQIQCAMSDEEETECAQYNGF